MCFMNAPHLGYVTINTSVDRGLKVRPASTDAAECMRKLRRAILIIQRDANTKSCQCQVIQFV